MKLLPSEKLIYKTHLSKDEIINRLKNETEAKQWIRTGGVFTDEKYKTFEGIVNEDSFQICRIIRYRNSFLPQIEGEIEQEKENTLVHIKMRLHTFVIVFLIIWSSFLFLGGIFMMFIAWAATEDKNIFVLASLAPFVMMLVMLVTTFLAFNYERDKAKELFEKLFEAERENR